METCMNKRRIGADKEILAADYLKNQGYRILKQNFFCKDGEIDIIAQDDGVLCFIEVKYRSDLSEGYPEEAVDINKIRRISRSAVTEIVTNSFFRPGYRSISRPFV